MATGKNCGACGNPRSRYVMNNKLVCLRCDELLFDIEIECEEEVQARTIDEKLKGRLEGQPKKIPVIVKKA